jgi:flagellin
VAVQISGAGLANPVNITFNSNDATVAAAINDLTTQIKNNSELQLAGISVDQAKDTAPLTFTSSSGQTFNVLATGDTANYLGLGTFANASATSAPTYTSMLGLSVASADTGNGLSTLAFSLNGGATGTAASVTGTAVTAGYADTSTNHTLALSIDGTSVSLEFNNDTNKGTQESLSNIVSFINSQIQSTLGLNSDVNLASVSSNAITIRGRSADRLGTVAVTAANLSAALGLTVNNSTNNNAATVDTITSGTITAGQANTTGFGGTKILALVVDGTAVSVDFNNDPNKAGTESVQNIANYINTTVQRTLGWGHDVTVAAAGATSLTLTAPTTGHTVSIDSAGSAATALTGLSLTSGAGMVAITGTGSALNTVTLNLAGGDATGGLLVGTTATPAVLNTSAAGNSFSVAVNGNSILVNFTSDTNSAATESIANIVLYMNSTIQKALGTSANLVSVDALGKIEIASPDKGADASVSIAAANTFTAALNLTTNNVTANTGTNGAGPTAASVANMLGYGFQANSSLQKAGFQATVTGGQIQITSNGTQFRVDAWGTVTNGKNSDVGFGHTGLGFAGTVAGPSRVNVFDAGGVSATPASGISFLPMMYGNDTQAITISTNDVSGVMQAKTITLQNNGTAQTGANIDSAVSYINSILQQSNNSTLQRIMAVKENVGGSEAIRFVSSLNAFQVSVGASPNGLGVNGGLPETVTSALNGSASTADIGSQQGAAQAVIAVGAAVTKLGSAQAAVGKGQNQLTYAISLAQSQITNFSAAESYIRDANVAQQAANLTKAQVLQQASIAAMAQANSAPQAVLALLRG